jgi:hypothetical protein
MKLLTTCKDGGPESTVWAHVLFEIKALASVMLLRFENGSRDAYHSHAFNCISWVIAGGGLLEERVEIDTDRHTTSVHWYRPSWRPIVTLRSHCHKVTSRGRTWVLTFRGPWADRWTEIVPGRAAPVVLENGRREVTP